MPKTNFLSDFFTRNLWGILGLLITIGFLWSSVDSRVRAVETELKVTTGRVDALHILVERIIVLEERDRSVEQDISEIKGDLREIKNLIQ